MRDHKANKHNIGVTWHHCTENGNCEFKFKTKIVLQLRMHVQRKHKK